ncbi:MAG: molybdenum cofactor guanylyltransferase [Anaerolineales bacterium]
MRTLVIQAGGESRRMGRDKALVPFLGQPLIQRVLERLRHIADEHIITTNHPANYRFLGLPLITDIFPGRGALGGLYTALQAARYPYVAIVACDMPFANAQLFKMMFEILEKSKADAVIPQWQEGNEPFHAVYRKETSLPLVKEAIEEGYWRADAWYGSANIRFLSAQEVMLVDPQGLTFRNVNTPEELAAAEELARQLDNDAPINNL